MLVRLIASAVIAALLLIGFNPSAPQTPETAITAANPVEQVSAAITPAPVQLPAPVVETTQPAITETEAQTIALTHATLTADAVTALHSHLDTDDRIPHWEVEFRQGDWEYDYEISQTGEILHHEKELDPLPQAPAVPAPTEPAPDSTAQQAQAIALTHAGLTADAVPSWRSIWIRMSRSPTGMWNSARVTGSTTMRSAKPGKFSTTRRNMTPKSPRPLPPRSYPLRMPRPWL